MDNKIDLVNLKKLAPITLSIGAGLGIIVGSNIYFGRFSGLIFLAVFIFCGGLYANSILKTNSPSIINIAINGALLTATTEIAYDVLSSILFAIFFDNPTSLISLPKLIEAMTIGALGAIAWYAYNTNNNEGEQNNG